MGGRETSALNFVRIYLMAFHEWRGKKANEKGEVRGEGEGGRGKYPTRSAFVSNETWPVNPRKETFLSVFQNNPVCEGRVGNAPVCFFIYVKYY